jgi:nitroreductase
MITDTFTDAAFRSAVRAAIRAPSMHNSQPWRFRLRDGAVEVLADPTRRLPVADPNGWAVRIACGAAAFNARLALAVAGLTTEVVLRPDNGDPDLMVRLVPTGERPATPAEQRLYDAISQRRSNRTPFFPEPVPADARAAMVEAARMENAWLDLLIGTGPLAAVGEIARAAGRVLDRDPDYRVEIAAWSRDDESHLDGVPASAGGPSPEPQDLLPSRPFHGYPRAPHADFESNPLVAILGTAGDTRLHQVAAGMALQRVLLTATAAGLSASMLSQPIEVPPAREQLRLALGRFGTPQMVLRIGYGQPGFPTPRRDIDDVIEPSGELPHLAPDERVETVGTENDPY